MESLESFQSLWLNSCILSRLSIVPFFSRSGVSFRILSCTYTCVLFPGTVLSGSGVCCKNPCFVLTPVLCVQGWFSPGQVFVLDEYQARYGVRGCQRHLCYLSDLLDRAEAGVMIDPTLLHYSFAFCASHVHGNR